MPSQRAPVFIPLNMKRRRVSISTRRGWLTVLVRLSMNGCSPWSWRTAASRASENRTSSCNLTPSDASNGLPSAASLPEETTWLNEHALTPFIDEVRAERLAEVDRIADHVEISLTEVLQRVDLEIGRASEEMEKQVTGAEGRLAQAEARHDEAMARRDRRRRELTQQRALTLQGVERMTSVLVLPHPDSNDPEIKRLRPSSETEMTAMRVVMDYEAAQGRHVKDVHKMDLGYDVTSLDAASGELRLIEVKGLAAETGTILLTPNEHRVAEDRRDCFWLYVVTKLRRRAAVAGSRQRPRPVPLARGHQGTALLA